MTRSEAIQVSPEDVSQAETDDSSARPLERGAIAG